MMLLITLLTGCGFHLKGETEVQTEFKKMFFSSYDPYGLLSRYIHELLSRYHVKLVTKSEGKNYPSLEITSSSLNKSVISIYQDGKSAENQLVLIVEAQVVIAGKDIYPIRVRISRTFFDNPSVALAKTTEQELITQEMYEEAAQQVIAQLKTLGSNN